MSFFNNQKPQDHQDGYTDAQKAKFRENKANDVIAQLPNIVKLFNAHPKASPAMTKALKEIGSYNKNSRKEWVDGLMEIWDANVIERDKLSF